MWLLIQFGPLAALAAAMILARRRVSTSSVAADLAPCVTLVVIACASVLSVPQEAVVGTARQVGILVVVMAFLGATYTARWPDREVLDGDIRVVYWVGVVTHALGLAGHLSNQSWAEADYDRYVGLMTNANFSGMSAALLVTLIPFLRGVSARAAGLIPAIGLILSDSRGSLIAAAAGLGVTALTAPAVRARLSEVVLSAGGLIVLVLSVRPAALGVVENFADRVEAGGDVTSGRSEIYAVLISQWRESPWFGTGYRSAEVDLGSKVATAHNVYLTILVELGVVGLIVFLWFVLRLLLAGSRQSPLFGAAVAVLVVELTESSLFGFGGPTALTAWLIMIGYASTGRYLRRSSTELDELAWRDERGRAHRATAPRVSLAYRQH